MVPPRPNLGPEPWSETRFEGITFSRAAPITAVLLFLVTAWILLRRRAVRRRHAAPPADAEVLDDTPSARLLRLAERARETLATRFGPPLRARTTEEIATDATLREALSEVDFGQLIDLLSLADRWKFALAPENAAVIRDEDLSRWEAWCEALPAGPRSRSSPPLVQAAEDIDQR